jgi:hypothetical protein
MKLEIEHEGSCLGATGGAGRLIVRARTVDVTCNRFCRAGYWVVDEGGHGDGTFQLGYRFVAAAEAPAFGRQSTAPKRSCPRRV